MSIYTYNGAEFSEEDVIAKAKEKGMDLNSYINKFGIEKVDDGPGKKKPVVVGDATVAGTKNTASKSAKPSSVSQDNPFGKVKLFDPLNITKNALDNARLQKSKKAPVFTDESKSNYTKLDFSALDNTQKQFNFKDTGKSVEFIEKEAEKRKDKEYEDLISLKKLKDTALRNTKDYQEAISIINKAGELDDDFNAELEADIQAQKQRNGKIETINMSNGGIGGLGGGNYQSSSKFLAFPDERKQIINQFKKENKKYTENEVVELAAELYKNKKEKQRIYNQKYDAFEDLDGYSDAVQSFVKDYTTNEDKIADVGLAKIVTQKNYTQAAIEKKAEEQALLESKLKPKNYKFTSQEELDEQNELIQQINKGRQELKSGFDHYKSLNEEETNLQSASTTLKQDVDLLNKEWGWWERTGLKTLNAFSSLGGSLAGGAAYLADLGVQAGTLGNWDNSFGNYISEKAKTNKEFYESKIAKPREATYSIESFGEKAADAILNQLPIIATTIAAPETLAPEIVGLGLGLVSGTGSKYTSMLEEQKYGSFDAEGNKIMPQYNVAQLMAVPLLFGAFEGGTEYVGGRAIGRMQKAFGKATKAEADMLLEGARKSVMEKSSEFSKSLLQNYGEEIPTEVLNTVLGNVTDKVLLGKEDTDILDSVPDVIFDTAVVSTFFGTAPHIAGVLYKPFIPSSDVVKLADNNKRIADMLKGVDFEKLSPEEKSIIDSKVSALKDSSSKIINNIAGMIGTTDTQDLLDLNNFSKQMIDVKKQAQVINNSSNLSDEQKKAMLSEMKSEYSELSSVYNEKLSRAYRQEQSFKKANSFLNNRRINKDIKLGNKFSTQVLLENPNVDFKYANGKEIVDMMMSDPVTFEEIKKKADKIEANDVANGAEKYSAEQRIFTQKAVASEGVNANGWFDPNTNKIYVNKSKSLKEGRFGTARHEFFHKVSQNFANNMGSIGTALYDFVKESHSGPKKFEETDFYKRMDQEIYDLNKETRRLEENSKAEISNLKTQLDENLISKSEFNTASKAINQKLNSNIKIATDAAYEEASTILAESLEENDIQIAKDVSSQLKFDEEGNVVFNNAKDVFNFIVAYNESFSKSKGSKSIEAASKGKVAGELIKNTPAESAGDQIKLSKPQSEILKEKLEELKDNEDDYDMEDFEQQVDNLKLKIKNAIEKEKSSPKVEVAKKEVALTEEDELKEIIKDNKSSIASDKVQRIYEEKGVNGAPEIIALFKPITKKIIDKRRDAPGFEEDLFRDELESSEQGILGLIMKYDASKGIPLAAYINKYLPVRAIAVSRKVLDKEFSKDVTEEKGLMAEETVSETKEKPTFKNALESNVFEPDVLKTITSKILTQVRTLKSRIDEPISLNRTVTPLITEIRDAVGKQLDIDVKTAMGGKKDNQLVNWLLKNKRYVLENMTTTWLMGKDGQGGIPQAIQKRIDGKWVNYPDWVGQKIDREAVSTDNAGRTSGAELVRRLPNVFNNVSNEDYLAQVVGPDGNPIRGRKESLAKAVSEESAFDIINKDLAEEGEIYDALSANQERLGYEVLNNFAATFSLQSERGNIKRSKALNEALKEVENLPESTKLILIGDDGNKFIKYASNVTNEDEAEASFYNTYSASDFSPKEINVVINAVKKLLSYYSKSKAEYGYKKITSGPKETESFEDYANRKVFNAMSKDQSIATILGIPVDLLQWTTNAQRKAAQESMKNFHANAVEYLTKDGRSIAEANKLFTRLFSRGFSYGKNQSMFEYQEDFYNTFLKNIKGFELSKVKNGKTITYNGKKVNFEIGGLEQKTSAPDVAKYLSTGDINNINYSERKKLSDLSKKDLKEMMTMLSNMQKAGTVTNIQLGLIFKSLGGSMASPLKMASELRYAAETNAYSKNATEWVYEHVPPTAWLTRMALGTITKQSDISVDEFMETVMGNAYVTILPKKVDNVVNTLYKSTMPFHYRPGMNPLVRYFDAGFNGYAIPTLYDLSNDQKINNPIKENQFYSEKDRQAETTVLESLQSSKKSKGISDRFNKIIEENEGVENYKNFSDIVARRRGTGKNRFDIYVPASAADFELLLYNFMGEGKKGEEQKKFFTDTLLKPYANGNDLMDAARQSIKNEYKQLLITFPDVAKKIEKKTPDGDFTYDQAIRVAMWNDEGVEIPGLSQRDTNKLTDLVNSDPELNAFKEGLIVSGRQGRGWVKPEQYWDANTIITDLHNLTEGEGRKKFLSEFIANAEEMFGSWENGKLVGPNINKVEAVYGTDVREALEDVLYRMTTGKNRGFGKDKETSNWANWVTGSTGAIMFLNVRSAALQLIGAVNFLNLRDNNPYAAAKAFANQKQYWEDFARIWNSDKMKERRGGLKEDVAAAEIANAASGSKNKVGAVLSYLLKVGYTPTQMADSFAIASGGAPFYRNRIKSYLKEGMTEIEAEDAAWDDFTKVSDETQQSGDPRDISKQQASAAGRLLLTFQNTAMQQSRIVKKAFLDLKNGRGDTKTNFAKIAYYVAIQNTMFAVLQQGLFAVAFGDDDEDEEKPEKEKKLNEKLFDVADGVVDTILRGTGFAGGIVATVKNMAKKYLDERDKKFKADYAKVVLEGANLSPPIGSKLRKLYSGLQQTKFDKDLIEKRGWDVMQDGRVKLSPSYGVTGKVVEAFTNVPMDRLVTKVNNASEAMNSQNTTMQRIMVGLGWSPYSAGIEDSAGDKKIREEAKTKRKVEGIEKAKETRERTKDSIRQLPVSEQLKLRKEMALDRREKRRRRKMG